MLETDTRTAILELLRKGYGTRAIARSLKISRQSVRDVKESGSSQVPEIKRSQKAEDHLEMIRELYERYEKNIVRVHEELEARGIRIAYSTLTRFCRLHGMCEEPPPYAGGMTKMDDNLDQLLKSLGLKRIREIIAHELERATKIQSSYAEFLAALLRQDYHYRQGQSLKYRFIGDTGVGKTGLATGILLKALENGYRGRFVKAQDLFDEMFTSLADRSTTSLVRHLANIDVLLIDEMGYLNIKPEQSNIFFKLMEERYGRKPTIITTNLQYDDWYGFLGNKNMVAALLSRLRHHCFTISIDGPSLRSSSESTDEKMVKKK